jgi:hypothetical protein
MSISEEWSQYFGLAKTPLFEQGEIAAPDHHSVLVDGGDGSFILSQSPEPLPKRSGASWAWSAYLPHHVSVSETEVVVTRWTEPDSPAGTVRLRTQRAHFIRDRRLGAKLLRLVVGRAIKAMPVIPVGKPR